MRYTSYIAAVALVGLLSYTTTAHAEVVDAADIPTNLRSAEVVQLTGTWDTQAFTDLATALGTTGFMASNNTLVDLDMGEAQIEPGTSLYVNGGFSSNGAFVNCKALQTVIMPAADQAANFANLRQAFMNCTSLTTIDLSACSGLTSLNSAFENCSMLTEVNLVSSTQLTGSSSMSSAFRSCTSLTKVTLPAQITFASRTFGDCTALTDIYWTAYNGTEAPIYYQGMFEGISDLKAINLSVLTQVASLFEGDANWSQLTIKAVTGLAEVRMAQAVTYADNTFYTSEAISDAAIYAMNGACVASRKVVEGAWSVEGLARGVYVLSYKHDGLQRSIKFIKR